MDSKYLDHFKICTEGGRKHFSPQDITAKDRLVLKFGMENRVDFIAQSFVQGKQDIIKVRDFFSKVGFECQLIAKNENRTGVINLAEIMEVSDAIMIARGDLGVSLPIYAIPILQKRIIKICRQNSKIVITATPMLESMTVNPRPTRADASDVANAAWMDPIMLCSRVKRQLGNIPLRQSV